MLGTTHQWADGKLDAKELAADPEAVALVGAFKDQLAGQLGIDHDAINVMNVHGEGLSRRLVRCKASCVLMDTLRCSRN